MRRPLYTITLRYGQPSAGRERAGEPPATPVLLHRLDGQISYNRARLMGSILRSLTTAQRAALDDLKARNGVGDWDRTLPDPLQSLRPGHDVNVAVMTYASEMYSWYAGSVTADVYFCPERQGTYFGSFYLKDWPAMGNPNYTINEQLTATAGRARLCGSDGRVPVLPAHRDARDSEHRLPVRRPMNRWKMRPAGSTHSISGDRGGGELQHLGK